MREYRYTECGLNNVIIRGAETAIDDDGEEMYTIPNINGLHRVIAHSIITREHGIAPEELRFLRTEMGLTQAELAELVKKDHQTVGRWERGETPIDQNAELVVRMVAAERLAIAPQVSVEDLARRCVPTAHATLIAIDGSDPQHYRQLAA